MILAKKIMSRWLVTGSLVFGLVLSACGGGGGGGGGGGYGGGSGGAGASRSSAPQQSSAQPQQLSVLQQAQTTFGGVSQNNTPTPLSGQALSTARSNIRSSTGYLGSSRSFPASTGGGGGQGGSTNSAGARQSAPAQTIESIDTKYDYAHALGLTGLGKKIAIADSMLTPEEFKKHPALGSKMDNADYYGHDLFNEGSHGTAVASIAAGKDLTPTGPFGIRGIAMEAKVVGLRTDFTRKPGATDYKIGGGTLAEGVKFAEDKGAIAINNSWGFLAESVPVDASKLAKFNAGSMTAEEFVSDYIISNNKSPKVFDDLVKGAENLYGSKDEMNKIIDKKFGTSLSTSSLNKDDWSKKVAELYIDSHSVEAIKAYVDALDDFQNQGVVVFAHDNEETNTESQLVTRFPEFFPKLKEAWIAVANASPTQLVSESCLETAAYCLVAHGEMMVATPTADYARSNGASFAAPQVAGAVAIMAQAFPTLTPKEWTSRLLASGDRSRRYPGDKKVGIVDFGKGVKREIFEKQGHGALDVEAALNTIGTVTIPTTSGLTITQRSVVSPGSARSSSSGSRRHFLSNTRFRTSRAFGRGLGARLSQREMAVFDGLNTPFSMNLGTLFSSQDSGSSALLERMSDFKSLIRRQTIVLDGKNTMSLMPDAGGRIDGVSFRLSLRDDLFLSMGYGQDRADVFNLHDAYLPPAARAIAADSFGLSYAHLADKGYSVSLAGGKGPGWGVSLFGSDQTVHGPGASQSWGAMGRYGLALNEQAQIEFAVGSLAEQESILGARGEGALAMGAGTTTRFYGLSGRYGLGDGMSLIASYGQGRSSQPREAAGLLLSDFSSTRSDQFSLGLAFEDALSEGDRLSLSLSQPLSVRKSTARLRFPVGRTRAGKVTYEQMQIDFADRRRPLDLGVAWGGTLSDRLSVDAGISLRMKGDDGGRAHDYAPLVLLNMRYRL